MDELLMLLQAKLDEAKSMGNINSDIKKIQGQIDKLKVQAEIDPKAISNLVKQLEGIINQKINITNINIDVGNAQKVGQQVGQTIANATQKEIDKVTQKVNKIQLSMGVNGDTTSKIEVLRNNFAKLGLSADEVKTKMSGVDAEVKTLQSLMNSGADNSAIVSQFEKLKTVLTQTQNNLKQTRSDYSLLATEQQRLSLANTIEAWNQKNTRATKEVKEENDRYVASLRDLNTEMTKIDFNKINTGFKQNENSMRTLNKLGASLKNQMKQAATSFTQWISVSYAIMALAYQIKKIPKEVIEVDTALTELKKVSDASSTEITNYFDKAAESAKNLGATVSDVISATADWSRLGYNLPDSEELAKVAILYKNVGDGIDIDSANESLISTLQGFQLEAKDAMNIVDQFNEVSNNFPIDSAGIGEALQNSAASFYAANTDLSKSIALITGTNSVVQDPSAVGNMWKTVSMRIRGATAELEAAGEDTEGMVETTAQLRDLIEGMTGFDIMADEAGTQFKDIYEIVVGIGKEWQNLTDVEQASLLETLAGKRQGNALSAALNNISMIEDAYDTATNSAGSALKEQEEYEKSIQYSLDRLEASFQTFANHILDSDSLKGIVDFGNGVINVIDSVTNALGSLGTIGLGAGLFAGIKNVGQAKMWACLIYAYPC